MPSVYHYLGEVIITYIEPLLVFLIEYHLSMSNPSNLNPVRVLRENISALEIAKYYLEIEFSKLFKTMDVALVHESLDKLAESKVWALLEAISFTYHLNGVFFKLAREGYTWNEELWSVGAIVLTGMDTHVNKVIYSEEVKGDAIKFKNYLLNYFEKNKDSDPQKLFSYKPTNKEMRYTKLIATRRNNKIAMLDGSHRLTELLLNGTKEVHLFVGHPSGAEPEESKKTLIGNSTLILLKMLYTQGNDEEKQAVLTVVKEIIAKTLNGKEAARRYWIENIYNDEALKQIGERLLKE